MKKIQLFVLLILIASFSGCILAAAGVGAEAGYVGAQESRTAGETFDDQRITATIKSKMMADDEVSGLSINVDTFKRMVTLKGTAASQREADKAIEIAKSVSSVIEVRSELVVK